MLIRALLLILLSGPLVGSASSKDQVLKRSAVPNKLLKQGEVRLVKRDDALLVQTALNTRHINKVLKKIEAAEIKNWPDDDPDASDRVAFTTALRQAAGEAGTPAKLLIEFTPYSVPPVVTIYSPTYSTDRDGWAVDDKSQLQQLVLGSRYVHENAELILCDAFGWSAKSARDTLPSHGWTLSPRLSETVAQP